MYPNASFEELVAAVAKQWETPTKAVGASSSGRTKRPPALSPAAAAGGGRPDSHSRRVASRLLEPIAGGGDHVMPGLECGSDDDDDDDSEARRAKQARRAKAGEAAAAAVAAATAGAVVQAQQERKQYKRSSTSYGLRKLPKNPGCRKCKGNARSCRSKEHQLEDAGDEQVRSSGVLLIGKMNCVLRWCSSASLHDTTATARWGTKVAALQVLPLLINCFNFRPLIHLLLTQRHTT